MPKAARHKSDKNEGEENREHGGGERAEGKGKLSDLGKAESISACYQNYVTLI